MPIPEVVRTRSQGDVRKATSDKGREGLLFVSAKSAPHHTRCQFDSWNTRYSYTIHRGVEFEVVHVCFYISLQQ